MTLNLSLLYFVWTEEYCQTSTNKIKSPNLWHVTSILVWCIFGHAYRLLTTFILEILPQVPSVLEIACWLSSIRGIYYLIFEIYSYTCSCFSCHCTTNVICVRFFLFIYSNWKLAQRAFNPQKISWWLQGQHRNSIFI